MKRTREEIDSLKNEWLCDPRWDIEETGGFEEHREELAAFNVETHLRWHNERLQALLDRVAKLEERNDALRERVNILEKR